MAWDPELCLLQSSLVPWFKGSGPAGVVTPLAPLYLSFIQLRQWGQGSPCPRSWKTSLS